MTGEAVLIIATWRQGHSHSVTSLGLVVVVIITSLGDVIMEFLKGTVTHVQSVLRLPHQSSSTTSSPTAVTSLATNKKSPHGNSSNGGSSAMLQLPGIGDANDVRGAKNHRRRSSTNVVYSPLRRRSEVPPEGVGLAAAAAVAAAPLTPVVQRRISHHQPPPSPCLSRTKLTAMPPTSRATPSRKVTSFSAATATARRVRPPRRRCRSLPNLGCEHQQSKGVRGRLASTSLTCLDRMGQRRLHELREQFRHQYVGYKFLKEMRRKREARKRVGFINNYG